MTKQEQLYRSFLELKSTEEVHSYLQDLLTMEEIEEFSNRLQVAKMLTDNVTYIEITQKTGMSSTTIARISKWLTTGKGGYKLILERLNLGNNA